MRHLSLFLSLLLTLSLQAQNFKFAQLTDVHLNHDNLEKVEDLLRSIAQINATDGLDFVLITGDISDEGDRYTMEKAKGCFDLLRYPYYMVLGNHETKWSDSGCTAFEEIFGYERFELEHKGVYFLGFNTGPLMRMAYGHVVPQDITWMKEKLTEHRDKPAIIVTHYPLLEGDVDNWYDVTDALRKFDVRLCIGGHYHVWRNLSYDGIPGVLMRCNYRDKDGKTGYGIYEVTPDSIYVNVQRIGEQPQRLAAYSMRGDIIDVNGEKLDPNSGAKKYPSLEDNKTFKKVKETWMVQTGVGIYSSPAVEGDKVFVGDDLGVLTAYQLKDGKKLWEFQAKKRIIGTPEAKDGVVVFGSADRTIYGLNTADGSLKWTVKAEEPVIGAVTISNGIAYIGASDHKMRAIDILTGKVVWTYDGVQGYIETKPLVTDQHVVFGAWDNTLYSLKTDTGAEEWKWVGAQGMHYSPAAVWPVEAEGKIFIADPRRVLSAIDKDKGTTIWSTKQSMVRETIGLSEDGKQIYSKTMNDSIVCYSTEGNVPKEIWATAVGFGYEHAPSMPLEKEGIVYGSTKEGMIFALETRTGKLLWRHKIGNSLINTVVPIGKKRVLFTATSGEVGLLKFK
ncbi:MAG: PQQ-binding-like beta-propeller repeat protein [Bacteroidaceae bacterium]|nr:PQQ-binding-like beta-propeller repeat protein [Bacteroidaceae bacterium]